MGARNGAGSSRDPLLLFEGNSQNLRVRPSVLLTGPRGDRDGAKGPVEVATGSRNGSPLGCVRPSHSRA